MFGTIADVPLTDPELARMYSAPSTPWVRAVMVSSPSGHTTGPSGSSRDISGPHDLNVMTFLRSISDVVMVGATTAVRENYGAIKVRASRQKGTPPRLCIVSGSGHFEVTEAIAAANPLVITHHPHDHLFDFADVIVARDLPTAIRSLHANGYSRIDCEGGATLVQSMLNDGLIDEVDLTISPIESDHGPRMPDLSDFAVHCSAKDGEWQFQRLLRL